MEQQRFSFLPASRWLMVLILVLAGFAGLARAQATSPAQAPPTTVPASAPAANAEVGSGPRAVGDLVSKPSTTVEDWTTPALKGSKLEPSEALVGEIDEGHAAFTRELTRVEWRDGDPIDLYIIKPKGIKQPPVILYLYSYPFETARFGNDAFCDFLTKDGFAAVGFASALTGSRYRSGRPMRQWFVSELQESLATSAHDVQMILNYLATRGDLDMNRTGMFGDGSGASIAILAAAVDSRIKTLDLLNPWGDWPEWLAKSTLIPEKERADFLRPEFLAAVAPLDPVKWLPGLQTAKVRIREVMDVTVTPAAARQKVAAAAPPSAQVVRYPHTQDFLSAVSGGTGFDWIKQQLQPSITLDDRATNDSKSNQAAPKDKPSER